MVSRLLFTLIVFLPIYAIAAPAGGDPHAVPWTTIGVQAFNFLLLFSLLFYVLKGIVVSHFKERKRSYIDLVGRAEAAKKEAEANHKEISARLAELETSAKENAMRAQKEADQLKSNLLKEADEVSQKLREEAKKTAEIEIQKAKNEIQAYALSQAIEAAKNKLSSEASQDDQNRLQTEFIKKIQLVNQ